LTTTSDDIGQPSQAAANRLEAHDLPAWQPFHLDINVLQSLYAWNEQQRSKRLPALFENIAAILESKGVQFALDLIPDNPFPAGTLAKGLVGFAVLGMVCDDKCLPLSMLTRFWRREYLKESRLRLTLQFRS
jgi:hypothetical protein